MTTTAAIKQMVEDSTIIVKGKNSKELVAENLMASIERSNNKNKIIQYIKSKMDKPIPIYDFLISDICDRSIIIHITRLLTQK